MCCAVVRLCWAVLGCGCTVAVAVHKLWEGAEASWGGGRGGVCTRL